MPTRVGRVGVMRLAAVTVGYEHNILGFDFSLYYLRLRFESVEGGGVPIESLFYRHRKI